MKKPVICTKGEHITYREINGCYILEKDHTTQTAIFGCYFQTSWGRLTEDGLFTLYAGFAWDGASGPAIDRKENMRASCIHDGFFKAFREGLLPRRYREKADHEYVRRCEEDGMCDIVANMNEWALHHFAASAVRLHSDPYPVQTAP